MSKKQKFLLPLLLFTYYLLPIAFPPAAQAASWQVPCVAPQKQASDPADVATLAGLECAFANVISVALALSAIVIFVMFLIGGLRYLASGGDPKAVESAKATLTHAVAGLVILVLAFVVLVLLKNITGVDVTKFRVRTD